ncbi:hypothetical protein AOLI_G00187640 [Acnodon oligacanthus]
MIVTKLLLIRVRGHFLQKIPTGFRLALVQTVKPEMSTARTHQKLQTTTRDEVKEALPKSYSVKCTATELTAEKVQERSESPKKFLKIIESEEQAKPSMSCIQKNPETDGSSCPVEEEAILQHKPSEDGDDLV